MSTDYVPVTCKRDVTVQHESNKAHKACLACFPMVSEANCGDCEHWTSANWADGQCRGRIMHPAFGCTAHTNLRGMYP